MAAAGRRFVEWEERFVSHNRGSRVVHYYVKDLNGMAFLAVVGTERSLRHMVYVVSEEFLQLVEVDKCTNSSFKWRARREVVDWLTSLLSKPNEDQSKLPLSDSPRTSETHISNWEGGDQHNSFHNSKGHLSRKLLATGEDIVWLGSSWTCGKRLKHYQSFCRNDMAISVHAFVYVMAEEKGRHIAYLEDMYEDKKLQKKVKVRWFHKTDEAVGTTPPPPYGKEVFMTPFSEVLSAERIDGQATILTTEHREKCLVKLPLKVAAQTHWCSRQCDNDGIRPFNLTELPGYFNQKILSAIDLPLPLDFSKHNLTTDSFDMDEEEDVHIGTTIRRGPRTNRSSRRRFGVPGHYCVGNAEATHVSEDLPSLTVCGGADRDVSNCSSERGSLLKSLGENRKQGGAPKQGSLSFDIGDRVEFLCQDSGIRGCWFRCTVIRNLQHQLKVRYEDVWTEDGSNNLEEWVPAFRIAAPDKLGMRISGRPTIRPSPENGSFNNFGIGTAVDAWWNDGWWEGVIVMIKESGDEVQVYFPGENDCSTFQRANLRISRDWVSNQWVDVKEKSDLTLNVIPLDSNKGPGTGCLQLTAFSKNCTASLASAKVGKAVNCIDWKLASQYLQVGVRESMGLLICEDPKNGVNAESRTESPEIACEDGICMKNDIFEGTFASEHGNGLGISSGQSKSVMPVHGMECIHDGPNDGLPNDLKWKSSRKRQRTGESSFVSRAGTSCGKEESERFVGSKIVDAHNMKNGEQLASNTKDLAKIYGNNEELEKVKMSRQGHENHKPSIGNSLFMSSMPIANLVMSR